MNNNRVSWIKCPRCIGGTMYYDNDGAYTCISCGCTAYPDFSYTPPIPTAVIDKSTGAPIVQEDNTTDKNLPQEDNAKKT